jgi:hypothetical protein
MRNHIKRTNMILDRGRTKEEKGGWMTMIKGSFFSITATAVLLFPLGHRVPVFLSGRPDLSPSMGPPDRPDIAAPAFSAVWVSFPAVLNNGEGE